MPLIAGSQKFSRCRRQASRSICAHSARGSTSTLTRLRSSQPLRRPISVGGLSSSPSSGRSLAGVDRAQLAVREVDQRARVGAEHEVVDLARQRRAALLLEVVREQLALGLVVVVLALVGPDAAHRKAREDRPPARADDAVVAALVHRKGQHAQRQAVGLDHDRRLRLGRLASFVVAVVVVVIVVVRLVERGGLGDERVGQRLAQGEQIRARRLRGSSARTAARRRPGGSRGSR